MHRCKLLERGIRITVWPDQLERLIVIGNTMGKTGLENQCDASLLFFIIHSFNLSNIKWAATLYQELCSALGMFHKQDRVPSSKKCRFSGRGKAGRKITQCKVPNTMINI